MSLEKAKYLSDVGHKFILDFPEICLTLTTKCNIRCKKCYMPKDKEMSLDILASSLKLLGPFTGDIFIGAGENLVSENLVFFLRWINSDHIRASATILTNGLLLHPDDVLYFGPKIKWGVTLDGFKQEEIEGLQENMDLDLVKSNIMRIKTIHPDQKMYLNYTLNKNNFSSLVDYMQFAIDYGISEVYITKLKIFENTDVNLLSKLTIDTDRQEVAAIFAKISDMALAHSIKLKLPMNKPYYKCKIEPMIDVEGNISFCVGRETSFISHVKDANLSKKWEAHFKLIMGTNFCNSWCEKCENNNLAFGDVQAISDGYKT